MGPTRDKKRPYGVGSIVGIEHQRYQAQRGWGTNSSGRMLRTVFGSVCIQYVCVYVCISLGTSVFWFQRCHSGKQQLRIDNK